MTKILIDLICENVYWIINGDMHRWFSVRSRNDMVNLWHQSFARFQLNTGYYVDPLYTGLSIIKVSCICFMYCKYCDVHIRFPGLILAFLTLGLPAKGPPSFPRESSRSNPCPHFSNCTQNDVTTVHFCWTSFCKKTIVYDLHNFEYSNLL